MEFRTLGSVEVVDDGRPIPIRRGKELALLAYLLLHANEVIPSERLIDELWGEISPSTAPKILQNAVSHLRRALGEGRIVTRGPGYVLRVEDGELDVQEFARLAREGKPEAALGLWRGPRCSSCVRNASPTMHAASSTSSGPRSSRDESMRIWLPGTTQISSRS